MIWRSFQANPECDIRLGLRKRAHYFRSVSVSLSSHKIDGLEMAVNVGKRTNNSLPPLDLSAAPVAMFLRRCGVRKLSPAARAQLYDLGTSMSQPEWRSLYKRAQVEGMSALVFAHAAEVGLLPVMPAEIAESLQTAYRNFWIWNRRLRGELPRINDALKAHNIDVIAFKGVTLAERLYGEIALRPIGDIDLLVRAEDLDACGRILARIGYAPVPGRAKQSQWHALVNRALNFRHDAGFLLDVHWAVTSQPAYVVSFPLAEIWQSAERMQLVGRSVRRLSAADELRYLCYHYAAQHEDKRLIWLVDIAEIVRTLPPTWDWGQFAADTIVRGLATPVSVALNTAQTVLELAVPTKLLMTLGEAAERPQERAAWRVAQASRYGLRAMYEHIKVQNGIRGRIAFAWQGFLSHGVLPTEQRLLTLRQRLPALRKG